MAALQAHLLTPETGTTTHYLWAMSGPGQGPDPDSQTYDFLRRAFEDEDRPMIEAAQRRMSGTDFWSERPVILPEDAGAILARRVLDHRAATERS